MDEPRGVRVICVSRGHLLVVEHHDRIANRRYWCLPGGGREPGETLEQTAVREVYEETGVTVHSVHRVPMVLTGGYALFIAQVTEHVEVAPQVDLSAEVYLIGAAWHPVERANPLGPLQPLYWGDIASEIAGQLE